MRSTTRPPSTRARGRGIALTLLLGLSIALAAAGSLDPGFDGNGLLSLQVGDSTAAAYAVAQQADGKLILVGQATLNPSHGSDFVVARITDDGTLDSTFSGDGIASADFEGLGDIAVAVVRQSDGKLVLAGSAGVSADNTHVALARFNVDGTLDTTFGVGGKARLDLGGSSEFARGLVQQANGKLVIAGETNAGGSRHMLLARVNINGTLDGTFGTGGTTLIDFVDASTSWANALEQQSDGKLIAAGGISRLGRSEVGIARVTADGALDDSFDGDGIFTYRDGQGRNAVTSSIAVQPDGAVVAAGRTTSLFPFPRPAPPAGLLLRVNQDGSITVVNGSLASLNDIVAQPDGKLVATGYSTSAFFAIAPRYMNLVRFNSDGTRDTTYGNNGTATADFGERDIAATSSGVALIRQADGKYVAVGPNGLGTFGAARFDDAAAFPGNIGLTTTNRSAGENFGELSYLVRRTGGMTGAVSVGYETTAALAQPDADFENTVGTLTWADGDASDRTITVPLINDFTAEPDEDFKLVLSAPTGGAQLAASEATVTIQDDDVPGQSVFLLSANEFLVAEGNGVIVVPVERVGDSTGAVSVSYSTTGATALSGTDFTATSGTLDWAVGDTATRTITIHITDDTSDEAAETFTVTLSDPSAGSAVGANPTATVTIADDDAPSGGGGNGGGGGGSLDWLLLLILSCLASASRVRERVGSAARRPAFRLRT